ncbi:hypothetical protein [Neorhizobium sp. NCHU2750]|uniref:hypothetical protein n=1 Tax=Neorhizobium sp. NCHU2750 TaxID=1825976 RepID=UPI000EB65837|nr:flagellar protein [Neorhizobium sp. NCHU2750]
MAKLPGKIPFRRRRSGGSAVTKPIDRWIVASLIGFSMLCAAFPWYVFFNQDKFGVNVAGWEGMRNASHIRPVGDAGIGAMRDPLVDEADRTTEPPPADDRLTTAAIPSSGSDSSGEPGGFQNQPFPGGTDFKLLHVANGRALIENASGIFLVQIGSTLPDNSRLASLRQRSGKWEIVTSAGKIYSE